MKSKLTCGSTNDIQAPIFLSRCIFVPSLLLLFLFVLDDSLFPSERVSSCARSRALSLNQFLTAINSCCILLLLFVVDFKIKYTYVVFVFFIQMILILTPISLCLFLSVIATTLCSLQLSFCFCFFSFVVDCNDEVM